MDSPAWIMVAIAAIGCLLTSIGLIVKVTYLVSSIELTITNKVSEAKKKFFEENDKLRKEVAETIVPLKSLVEGYEKKHFALELYIRDNYIEVSTFKDSIKDLKDLIGSLKIQMDQMNRDSVNWRKGRKAEET